MAHYNVFVQDSSPLFIYSPVGAWIDTPLESNDSPSLSFHATHVHGATVELDFVGTGVHVFSATVPTPGSYEVYIDGEKLLERVGPSSRPDSQLLLGSIAGLEMAPHTVTLVNSGETGDFLDLDRVEVESIVTSGSTPLSTATFDDTADEIQWGPGWVSTLGQSTFHNGTTHYTDQPDAKVNLSFEGDAIAIYGTTGSNMGNYVVTLDGRSHTFNGGSNGSARIPHDKTILYLANGLGAGRHELTITANPASLGKPQVFNIDLIKVFSGSSSSGPVLLPPVSPDTGTSSTLPPSVPTGSSYTSVISSTVFPGLMVLPTSTSSTLSPSLMHPPSTLPTLLSRASFESVQQDLALSVGSNDFKMMTSRGLIASAIVSAAIAGIGLIFFALFIWKRKTMDPPPYSDLEKGNGPDKKAVTIEPGEESPELPIQHAYETPPSPNEKDDPFADFAPYPQRRGSLAERMRGHSRKGSVASSMTANESVYNSYDLYRETLQKRALLTNSVISTDSTCRDSVSDCGSITKKTRGKYVESISSVHSDSGDSQYSQTSERIFINNVRMPPQFSTPIPPPFAVMSNRPKRMSPPRPPRVRDSLALPF